MENFNVLNKVITIENYNGDSVMTIEIDELGNIVRMEDCSVADLDNDYIFNTKKELIRLQADNEF